MLRAEASPRTALRGVSSAAAHALGTSVPSACAPDRAEFCEGSAFGRAAQGERDGRRGADVKKEAAKAERQSGDLQQLPLVLASRVLSFLDGAALSALGRSCRAWHVHTRSERLWQRLYGMTYGLGSGGSAGPRVAGDVISCASSLLGREGAPVAAKALAPAGGDGALTWHFRYQLRRAVDRGWRQGHPQRTRLVAHRGTVTCLALQGERLLSGSDDGSLSVWSLEPHRGGAGAMPSPPPALALASLFGSARKDLHGDGKENLLELRRHLKSTLRTPCQQLPGFGSGDGAALDRPARDRSFHGHGGPVWCAAVDDAALNEDVIVSGSYDNTLKVWNQSGCRKTLRGHGDWVSGCGLRAGRIVSCGYDAAIRLWDLGTGECRSVLHAGDANCLFCLDWANGGAAGERLVVGCRSLSIQLWDLGAERLCAQLRGHRKVIYAVRAAQDWIATASADATVRLWDPRSQESVALTGHTQPVMAVASVGWRVVSGSYDETVRLWDARRPDKALRSFKDHSGAVFCVAADERRLISGGVDHTICVSAFGPPPPSGGTWGGLEGI